MLWACLRSTVRQWLRAYNRLLGLSSVIISEPRRLEGVSNYHWTLCRIASGGAVQLPVARGDVVSRTAEKMIVALRGASWRF
jgi:hypothetical protein